MKAHKRQITIVLAACALLMLLAVAIRADRRNQYAAVSAQSVAAVGPKIMGTWATVEDNRFQFRGDGTGRSRDLAFPQVGVNYFEWTSDGTTLTIYDAPRGRIASAFAYMIGVETIQFAAAVNDDGGFTLNDGATVTKFMPVVDAVLDSAP